MNAISAKKYRFIKVIFNVALSCLIITSSAVAQNTPSVSVSKVNSETVKRYEKFEMLLGLQHVEYDNPYDPAEVDVYAIFTSPSGKNIRINGFFDDFNEAGQWKIRFSPDTEGRYEYQVFVETEEKKGSSEKAFFDAIASEHNGWIRQSEVNPRYFSHDDGSTYFAVGVYSPWRNNKQRFDTFEKYNANLFAIWDIGYGGFVNGTGIIEEELGRYNQEKCGRIDSLLSILEGSNIQLMFAIWPHDLFSATVWATQWEKNPYRHLIDVEEVYSDPLVWEYQKKKYRYLIARFAHSRSWGIWELINEMNGTDGWEKGRHHEAYDWVRKAQKYFEENDPYRHPVTASFSGGFGEYREMLFEITDVPNLHLYPRQGWALKYPEDSLRSAMYNYAWAACRFSDRFEKPSVFGESGAEWEYFTRKDPRYGQVYHNALWATLANGLAGIPVWWDYTFLTTDDWEQLSHVAGFVKDIDFANLPYKPLDIIAGGVDIYLMDASNESFGWLRSYETNSPAGISFTVPVRSKGKYAVLWYDTWTGRTVKTENVKPKKGSLHLTAPSSGSNYPDIAFKIRKK